MSRFLNYRTVVASVELSIVDALPSKQRPELHKSRVSLNYSQVYIYFDLVILIINSLYSYLHGYAYFEYVSCLVEIIITFVCGFIERLAC